MIPFHKTTLASERLGEHNKLVPTKHESFHWNGLEFKRLQQGKICKSKGQMYNILPCLRFHFKLEKCLERNITNLLLYNQMTVMWGRWFSCPCKLQDHCRRSDPLLHWFGTSSPLTTSAYSHNWRDFLEDLCANTKTFSLWAIKEMTKWTLACVHTHNLVKASIPLKRSLGSVSKLLNARLLQ